ncbi:MAG: hypothetical protein K6B14_00380 [Lachnospiraceae bacterium]|nr:hypothetical protein [Lachnospiraceae bacterium]
MKKLRGCAWVYSRFTDYMKREDVFPFRLRAAYTVEAAAVMGICMIFIGLLFMGGISLYGAAMETVASYEAPDTKPQEVFRLSRTVKGLIDSNDVKEGES